MNTIKMSEELNHNRRRFLRNAAVALASAELGAAGSADAQSSETSPAEAPQIRPGTNTSFGPLKRVNAGVLSIAYAERTCRRPAGAASARLAL
jgi:hypothetical protein